MDGGTSENLAVVQHAVAVFSQLDIAYALGGSFASTLYGRARFTQDADFAAEPFPSKIDAFLSGFGIDYYMSKPAIVAAIQRRSAFNIIHTPSGFKLDIFIRKDRPFDESLMKRRRPVTLPASPQCPIQFVSAEDIILLKLEWFRSGGESSDRQWQDILEIFQAQHATLDQKYLDAWATDLKVTDLLERIRSSRG